MAKVALTAAIMDLCHEGHVKLLKHMRSSADVVVVVLHSDESCWRIKEKIPIQSLEQRINNLKITGLVDDVLVTYTDDPGLTFKQAFHNYPAHEFVFIRGNDNYDFPGKATILELDIPIQFTEYTEGVSSTKIRNDLLCD